MCPKICYFYYRQLGHVKAQCSKKKVDYIYNKLMENYKKQDKKNQKKDKRNKRKREKRKQWKINKLQGRTYRAISEEKGEWR